MGKGKNGKNKNRGKHKQKKHSKQRNNKNGGLTFSALYIIVAFAFGVIAFLLGRGPLTSNFPMLEKFYGILPKPVTELSNNVLYSLGLYNMMNGLQSKEKQENQDNEQSIDSNNNNNNNNHAINNSNNLMNDETRQPLTKNKMSIDSKTMATSYFTEIDELNHDCDLDNWLMRDNIAFNGYHVLCVEPSNDASNGRKISYHRNGLYDSKTSKQFIFDQFNNNNRFKTLRKSLEKVLSIVRSDSKRKEISDKKDRWLKWEMYDRFGRLINNENLHQLFYGIILIFEVGLFEYPPINVGFERIVKVRNMNPDSVSYKPYLTMTLTTLSISPVVLEISGFIANEYCDYIIDDSTKYMRKSTVSHMHNTKGNANQWRTSSTHWLKNDDSIVHVIDCQTSSLTHLPLTHQENVQVLRYFEGEQYDSHWDYFDPSLYQGTNMQEKIRGGRNRFATLFWYMSNVTDGGWTYFPMAFDNPRPRSFKLKKMDDCNVGLKVTPKKGNAIIFYSMKPDGSVDPKSLHGACPVGPEQTKWGANKWIWTRPVHGYV